MEANHKKPKIEDIRHSLAHLLAMAVLRKFPGTKLGIGPVIENGFYYDFLFPRPVKRGEARPEGAARPLTDQDLPELEKAMREIIAQNLDFSGKKVTAAEAKKLFSAKGGSASGGKNQPFKLDLIKDFVKEKKQLTVYYTGDKKQILDSRFQILDSFADLCRGGHVKNTSEINPEAFKLIKIAGAYWKGSEKNPQLTRIYAVAFSTRQELDDYLKLQEEIAKRDHRALGEKMDLFSQHDIAPGAIFWHPKGMIVWRELERLMRSKLDRAGYGEVSTPIMVKKEVFEKSGHWQYYRDSMFYFDHEKETYVIKPMNCPGSTYIYNSKIRSYRDLPIRLSEITDKLHRNERSGTLGGLFRVRQMSQDDAHIYCRPDQIEEEIRRLFGLVQDVYKVFDLPVSYKLATRPDKAMGSPALWKKSEEALEAALKHHGAAYEVKPKDGAFYGPKIDIHIKDSLGRDWQLATIQLDFQIAERFDLSYVDESGRSQRPVVIHRAIFGTFERFIGILLEHYAGALPFWLSPIQVAILPINDKVRNYCLDILRELRKNDIRVSLDDRNESIGKKIREAEMQKIPFLLVVGEREASARTVSVRGRGRGDIGAQPLEKFLDTAYNLKML